MIDTPIDPAAGQQMDRSAPEQAMISRRQRLTGQATGIGSVGFQETGAFDVGDGDHPATDTPAKGA